MNADGTTPDDQPRVSPILAATLASPIGIAWDIEHGAVWVATRDSSGAGQLRRVAPGDSRAYGLPSSAVPTSFASVRASADNMTDLLVASTGDVRLLRVRLDRRAGEPSGTEQLLGSDAEPVRAVAPADDGTIFVATATSIGRTGIGNARVPDP